MDNNKMGRFIGQLRKDRHMTQKELAEPLHVTDKAVSKWERGLNYPDIALLPAMAAVLGVTVNELLQGEHTPAGAQNGPETPENAPSRADTLSQNQTSVWQKRAALLFSAALCIGLIVCAVCDLPLSGGFTWSLFPISSLVLSWLVLFPTVQGGAKGVVVSLAALSVLIFPYLYVLDYLIDGGDLLLPIGRRMAAIALVFFWGVWVVFRLCRQRAWLAAAICLLLAIPVCIVINLVLSRLIAQPPVDVWDVVTWASLLLLSGIGFALDGRTRNRHQQSER